MNNIFNELGEPGFRAEQLFLWVHKHGAGSIDEMTNLSLNLREKLKGRTKIYKPRLLKKQISKRDKTTKLLIQLEDGHPVETVIMPHEIKKTKCTVCISSQVGCPVGCPFCASGVAFERNLTTGEIISQVILANNIANDEGRLVTNIVFMGMGEPLLNLDAVLKAVEIFNDPLGLCISQRRIVISTSGYVPGIIRLAGEKLQIVLAVSLHSAVDIIRDTLVPLNKKYPIEQLKEACRYYNNMTGRRITIEYALINNTNDSEMHAKKLIEFADQLLANVNIIPLNPTNGPYKSSSEKQIESFVSTLKSRGVETSIRKERGQDIHGACGQLRSTYIGLPGE